MPWKILCMAVVKFVIWKYGLIHGVNNGLLSRSCSPVFLFVPYLVRDDDKVPTANHVHYASRSFTGNIKLYRPP